MKVNWRKRLSEMTFATYTKKEMNWDDYDKAIENDYKESLKKLEEKQKEKKIKDNKTGMYVKIVLGTFFAGICFAGIHYTSNDLKKSLDKKPLNIEYQQEKAKLDSIYQVKQDSLKRVYESKLEKGVK